MALTDAHAAGLVHYAGLEAVWLEAAEAILAGDAIHVAADGTAKLALATVGTAEEAHLVATQDAATGEQVPCVPACYLRGGRITDATIGVPVYLAEGTSDGQYTETKPATSGDVNTAIGITISATELLLFPGFTTKAVA